MKNGKGLLAMILVLATVLGLCACGSKAPAETAVPTEEESIYTVTVLDDHGAPIAGAMLQLCKDVCVLGTTDAEGVAKFPVPEDNYKVAFVMLPAGYDYADKNETFYFEDGSKVLTITLKAVG